MAGNTLAPRKMTEQGPHWHHLDKIPVWGSLIWIASRSSHESLPRVDTAGLWVFQWGLDHDLVLCHSPSSTLLREFWGPLLLLSWQGGDLVPGPSKHLCVIQGRCFYLQDTNEEEDRGVWEETFYFLCFPLMLTEVFETKTYSGELCDCLGRDELWRPCLGRSGQRSKQTKALDWKGHVTAGKKKGGRWSPGIRGRGGRVRLVATHKQVPAFTSLLIPWRSRLHTPIRTPWTFPKERSNHGIQHVTMVPRLRAGGEGEGLSCHTAAWGLRYARASGILNLRDTETPAHMAFGPFHAVSTVSSLSNATSTLLQTVQTSTRQSLPLSLRENYESRAQ